MALIPVISEFLRATFEDARSIVSSSEGAVESGMGVKLSSEKSWWNFSFRESSTYNPEVAATLESSALLDRLAIPVIFFSPSLAFCFALQTSISF